MASNGAYNLTVDGELRYLLQWFEEWSDFQREDFVPFMVSYLSRQHSGASHVNGIIGAMVQLNPGQDKPMSLFQCRVKLFNEWSIKWPEEFKIKLMDRLEQIDGPIAARIRAELLDGSSNGVTDEATPRELMENDLTETTTIVLEATVPVPLLVADED
ncbi:uncharacterized protein C14orf119 [Anopheles cruzii]|uniref:uncharacterized protein C14orf119 n=1 Tax=Anopheles cruzii TaxID=68878 RepID=UPI0022EC98D8|nr:uncharacterized protein C14orf119 [Anopheles cruzii]